MLVLGRKVHESFTIGDGITVTVCEIRKGQVKLGIEAPPDVQVCRDDAVWKQPRPGREHVESGTEVP